MMRHNKDTKRSTQSVDPVRRQRALLGHFRRAVQNYCAGDPVDFRLSGDDLSRWYAKISNIYGNNDEFKSGEYLLEIRAPETYPFDPPEFYFYTPNGVYKPHEKVCVDMGHEHAGNYPATIGMNGFVQMLLGGMIAWRDLGAGRHMEYTDIQTKHKYAEASHAFNMEKYPEIMALFDVTPEIPDKQKR